MNITTTVLVLTALVLVGIRVWNVLHNGPADRNLFTLLTFRPAAPMAGYLTTDRDRERIAADLRALPSRTMTAA
jgi:hypothetical protein